MTLFTDEYNCPKCIRLKSETIPQVYPEPLISEDEKVEANARLMRQMSYWYARLRLLEFDYSREEAFNLIVKMILDEKE